MRETLTDKVRILVAAGMGQPDSLDDEKIDEAVNALSNIELLDYIDDALNR